jgi:ParB-like chromosome segregation protein Spo0J
LGLPDRCEVQEVPLALVDPWARNPRKIAPEARDALRASLARFGYVEPLVVNRRGDRYWIVGGHQRASLLRESGAERARCVVLDLPEAEAEALAVTLNNREAQGEWTEDLGPLIADLVATLGPDVALALRLDQLRGEIAAADGLTDPDAVPEPPAEPIAKPGDLWILGEHRVLCGDSTKAADVTRLMDSARAEMMFTDPPWNVAIGKDSNPKHCQREGLANDDMSGEDFSRFLDAFLQAARPYLDGDLYCVLGASEWPRLDQVLRAQAFHWSATIIWVKDLFVLGRSKYQRRYEPIWYGWHSDGKSTFCERRDLDDVWEVPRPKVSEDHPTMKPVELVARAITNSSHGGGGSYGSVPGQRNNAHRLRAAQPPLLRHGDRAALRGRHRAPLAGVHRQGGRP